MLSVAALTFVELLCLGLFYDKALTSKTAFRGILVTHLCFSNQLDISEIFLKGHKSYIQKNHPDKKWPDLIYSCFGHTYLSLKLDFLEI